MSFTSDYDAGSENNADTVIEATFTGTGTLEVDFVDSSLDTISIDQRTLKVIVVGYNDISNDISNTFASMAKINHLNIVDLSGMVKNTGLAEGRTQGLDGFAFGGCTNLREITLFPNCAEIEVGAFYNCTSLKKIYKIPSGISAETDPANVNTIFGGTTEDKTDANMVTIFDIARGITTRGVSPGNAAITYSPVSAPAPEITVKTYSVTATATLNSPNNDYVASKIFSETVNSKPVITSSATFTANENQIAIGSVTATDADGNTSFTYSIVGSTNDNDKFSIDSSSGALTFNSAPNFDTPGSAANSNAYTVTVTASDTDANTNTQTIIVTVTDVNEAPTFSTSASFTVAENQTTVGTVQATDPEGATVSYSIVGTTNDNSKFSIDSSSGALTFKTAPNYENPGSAATPPSNTYTVIVTASDGTNSATQTITVNVTNVNETPTFSDSTRTINVTENQTTVGTVTATDPDSGTTLTYSISGADAGSFNIGSSSGALTFKTAPNFESPGSAANSNEYTVIVTASDGTNSATQTITVNVTNVNETPTFSSSATFNVAENQTTVGTVTATDPDSGTTLTYSISGADAGSFNIVQSTGALTFKTAPDFESPGSAASSNTYTVIVTASDGTNSTTQVITVNVTNVTNVNKAPTFTSSAVTSAKVGFEYTYPAVASDDDDGDTVTLSGTTIPSWLSFNTSTGKLTGTHGIDNVGDHSIIITATDSNLATATQSFTITVSRFKPANKTELQSAIDKWYELANGAK